MSRTSSLLAIRPVIPQASTVADTSPEETFQNKVLRPILKLQHPILCGVMAHYFRQKKINLAGMSAAQQIKQIEHSLQTDQRLIQLVTGLVIALFTEEEYQSFLGSEKELLKRIRALATQRIQSDIPALLH